MARAGRSARQTGDIANIIRDLKEGDHVSFSIKGMHEGGEVDNVDGAVFDLDGLGKVKVFSAYIVYGRGAQSLFAFKTRNWSAAVTTKSRGGFIPIRSIEVTG